MARAVSRKRNNSRKRPIVRRSAKRVYRKKPVVRRSAKRVYRKRPVVRRSSKRVYRKTPVVNKPQPPVKAPKVECSGGVCRLIRK